MGRVIKEALIVIFRKATIIIMFLFLYKIKNIYFRRDKHMKRITKTLSIFMAALFVMAGFLGNVTAKAAAVVVPAINYVGIEHSPLVVGDTEKFTVTSAKYEGQVQYRAFLFDGKVWSELTNGYTAAVDSKTPYVLPETKKFTLGKQKLSVWVKKAGETGALSNKNGDFDSYYLASLNCVTRDDANRVYADGTADFDVNGMKLTFNKIDGISGIEGPYKYAIHIMDASTGVWTNRATTYMETPSYTFTKPGTYMVVMHANTENSTTWKNYLAQDSSVKNQGSTYGTYEAWKTIMVTVKAEETVDVFNTTVKAATFGSLVNIAMTTEGTKMFASATKYQLFDGTKEISDKNGTKLGTATTVFPAKVLGDKVTVKLLDASGLVVKSIDAMLGQAGTVTVVPVVAAEVKATVKDATFGSLVTVTSAQEGATKYQLFDGTKEISDLKGTKLGTATTVFPAKKAGDKVTVKLFNAAGTLVSTSEVTLIAE
ncbi:MAG: hypothetical protein ACI8WT_003464 [Clostridium sp.]|jgi:hypothetical protein